MANTVEASVSLPALAKHIFVDENGNRANVTMESALVTGEAAIRASRGNIKWYPDGSLDVGATTQPSTFQFPATFNGNVFISGLASFTTNATANVISIVADDVTVSSNATFFKDVQLSNAALTFSPADADVDVRLERTDAGTLTLTADSGGSLHISANGEASSRIALFNNAAGLFIGPGNSAINAHTAFSYVANGVVGLGRGGSAAANAALALTEVQFAAANNAVLARLSHVGTGSAAFTANTGASFRVVADGEAHPRVILLNDGGGIGVSNGSVAADTYVSRIGAGSLGIGTAGYGSFDGTLHANTLVAHGSLQTNTIAIANTLTVGNTASITGNTTVGGTLGVTGNTALSGILSVTGNTSLSANLTVTNRTTTNAAVINSLLQVAFGANVSWANSSGSYDTTLLRSGDVFALTTPSTGAFALAAFGDSVVRWIAHANGFGMGYGTGSDAIDTYVSRVAVKSVAIGLGGGDATGNLHVANILSTGAINAVSANLTQNLVANNISTATAGILTFGRANAFGTIVSMTPNTSYTATSDGFVTVTADAVSTGGGAGHIGAGHDAGGPLRASFSNDYASVTLPVFKGEEVIAFRSVTSGSANIQMQFTPLGKNGTLT